jgi:predicted nucleotidyltransferase
MATLRTTRAKRVRAALMELQAALTSLYGADAPAILLYGSQARGEAGSASDVDVLLIYGQPPRRGSEIARLGPILADLNLRYQLLISIVPSARSEYERAAGPFWSTVRREGIALDVL